MVGCRAGGGKILGVIHAMWIGEEEDDQLDEMLVTEGDASRCHSNCMSLPIQLLHKTLRQRSKTAQ